tara:strand:- start:140 stop:1063 length:924 start_codon:yes stop_codon:yes gene_type:complete
MVKNSKILVAGGSGFIGENLILELCSKGNKVISISKNETKLKQKIKNVYYIFHDLNRPLKEKDFGILNDVDYVINCSGYINHKSFSKGGEVVFSNHLQSLFSLTNFAVRSKVKCFVQIGSSDEYGKNKSPIKESARENPFSPYALSKLTITHYLKQCYEEGILNTIILRPFLVFGERQKKDRFLPYLIDNCINNREFKVSKGEQIKDYLYIKDFNRALIKSLNNKKAYGEIINIASGEPRSIKNIIKNVNEIIGKGKPIFGGIDYRNGENMEQYANISKAKKILKWQPKYKFEDSLHKVIRWYEQNE